MCVRACAAAPGEHSGVQAHKVKKGYFRKQLKTTVE